MYYWVTIINWNFFNPILRSRVHCHYYLLYITIIVIITINDYIHMYCYNYYIPYYIYYYYYYLFIIIIVIDIIIAFSRVCARTFGLCLCQAGCWCSGFRGWSSVKSEQGRSGAIFTHDLILSTILIKTPPNKAGLGCTITITIINPLPPPTILPSV